MSTRGNAARAATLATVWLLAAGTAAAALDPPGVPPPADLQTTDETTAPRISIGGYLQADAVAYSQASEAEVSPAGAPLNETRFLLRRGRLALGYRRGVAGGALQIDVNTVNGPAARPVNAELFLERGRASDPSTRIRFGLGLLKIPFGREVVESSRDRFFLERSNAAAAFFPGVWDLGARVDGAWRSLRLSVALMNGEPIGVRGFPGRDPNQAKDIVGRVGADVLRGRWRLEAGASALHGRGFHRGTPASKDTLVWRDVNEDGVVQTTEIQVIAGTAATPSASFDRFALGGDARLTVALPRLGALVVMAELTWAENLDRALLPSDPIASARDLRQLGYYVGFTQQLTRHAQVGVRYDHYQPDADASERIGAGLVPRSERFSTLALAAAWIQGPSLRFVLEYDHNQNALGRFPNGLPRTLGRDSVILRGQLVY